MKPTLVSLALLSLLAAAPLRAATFLADGVTTSGGYYDVHKGYDGKDENMCWAAASSNVIQYWQDYYGVFYKGDAPLPNGASAYTGAGIEYGKRCLAVYEEFRNNWENIGGNDIAAMAWWMYGKTTELLSGSKMIGDNPAGYFKEYFESPNIFAATDRRAITKQTSQNNFNESIIQAFGDQRTFYNGRICYLGIYVDVVKAHALTCYGYETNDAGQVTGLWLCNSDDRRNLIFLCDIKKTDSGYVLVDHSTGGNWTYSGSNNWKIDQIVWINTPERLVNMQKAYSTADLVWNGGSTDWILPETTRGVLPTEASGWEASAGAGEGMFDSFFADGRNVVFNGSGNGTVKLHGDLAPASVLVDTSSRNYAFTGTGRLAGETTTLTVRGGGSLTIATSNTYGGGTTLLAGETVAAHQNALGTGSVLLRGGTLNIFGTGPLGSLGIGGDLTAESGSIVFDLTADGGDKLTVAFNDYYQSQQVLTFSHFFDRFLCNLHAFMRKKGVEPGTPMSEPGLSAEQKLLAYWCHILHNYRLAWEQSWETGILKIFTASKPSERKEFIEQYKLKRFVDIRKKKKKAIAEPHLKINSFLAVFGKENARPLRDRSLAMTWEYEAQKRLSLKSIDHETGEKSYGAFDDWMEDVAEEK